MMRMTLSIFLLLITISSAYTQNLVENSSFEKTDTCPSLTNSYYAGLQYWFDCNFMLPTLYYAGKCVCHYTPCSTNPINDVPSNWVGFQFAKDGDAYVGILLSEHVNSCRLQAELLTPLIADHQYCIEFYYNIGGIWAADWPNSINLEILFTDFPIWRDSIYPGYLNAKLPPQISKPIVFDTVNWVKYTAIYTAQGGETHMTVGNFVEDFNCQTAVSLYIDTITVFDCTPDTTSVDEILIPNVFTPNGDGINEYFSYANAEYWKIETVIYNRWGNIVFEGKNEQFWDGYFRDNPASEGVYFYIVRAIAYKDGTEKEYRGSVQLLR